MNIERYHFSSRGDESPHKYYLWKIRQGAWELTIDANHDALSTIDFQLALTIDPGYLVLLRFCFWRAGLSLSFGLADEVAERKFEENQQHV